MSKSGSWDVTEHTIEIEGKHYLFQSRQTLLPTKPDDPPNTGTFVTEYSFDQGESWHRTRVEGFRAAQESRQLMRVGEDVGEAGGPEAFVLALLQLLQKLEPGESLKIVRGDAELYVLKEEAVLVTKASLLTDIDLSLSEEKT